MFGTDLIIPNTLEDFCTTREQVIAIMTDAQIRIQNAKDKLELVGKYLFPSDYDTRYSREGFIEQLDRRLWREAFDYTGFMQLMDREEKQKFMNDCDKNPPPFTMENVRTTFLSVAQKADELFARGMVNVFRKLSRDHKSNTNEPFKVNRKAVLTCMVEKDWRAPTVRVRYGSYGGTEYLNDIDRVFKVLDGKKHNPRELEHACNASFSDRKNSNRHSDDYYDIRGFFNGNMHIIFKRDDLLEKANRMIGDYYHGQALAGGR